MNSFNCVHYSRNSSKFWVHASYSIVIAFMSVSFSLMTFMFTSFNSINEVLVSNNHIEERMTLLEASKNISKIERVTVTSYSPRKRETDSTPFINACNKRVALGQIAVSNNLWNQGFICGTSVHIENYGWYIVMDRMASRWKESRIDIFQFSTKQAENFGNQKLKVIFSRI